MTLIRTTLLSVLAVLVSMNAWGATEIKTDLQKFSYAIGFQIAQGMKKDNINVDANALATAIEDVLNGSQPRISIEDMQQAVAMVRDEKIKEHKAMAEKNQKTGADFLQQNKGKEGVVTLDSGLQYKVLKNGAGNTPKASDSVMVHYEGKLINGTVFDSSYARGEPAKLTVNGVIKGWQEALQLMKEGDKWQLFIPGDLAYGPNGAGGMIGPNETLLFEVELVKIN